MGGQWIFILLCLTFAGKLVFGSMFPEVPPDDPATRGTVTTQEVARPLNDLATPPPPPPDVTVVANRVKPVADAAKTTAARDVGDSADRRAREKNSEVGGLQAAEVLRKIVVEQRPNGRVITVKSPPTTDK